MRFFLPYLSVCLLLAAVGAENNDNYFKNNWKRGNVRRRLFAGDDTVGSSGCTRQQWNNGKRNCGGGSGGSGANGVSAEATKSSSSEDQPAAPDPGLDRNNYGYDDPVPNHSLKNFKDSRSKKQRYVGDNVKAYKNTDFDKSEDLPGAGYNGNKKRWRGNEVVGNVPRNADREFEERYGINIDAYEAKTEAQKKKFLKNRHEQERLRRQQKYKQVLGAEQGEVMAKYADDYFHNGAVQPWISSEGAERRKREKQARMAKRAANRKKLKGKNLENQIKKDEEAEADFEKREANIDNYFKNMYDREESSKMNYGQGFLSANREMDAAFKEEKRRQVQGAKLQETMDKYFNFQNPQTKAAFDNTVNNVLRNREVPLDKQAKAALKKAKKKKDKKKNKDTKRAVDKLLDDPNWI